MDSAKNKLFKKRKKEKKSKLAYGPVPTRRLF